MNIVYISLTIIILFVVSLYILNIRNIYTNICKSNTSMVPKVFVLCKVRDITLYDV